MAAAANAGAGTTGAHFTKVAIGLDGPPRQKSIARPFNSQSP